MQVLRKGYESGELRGAQFLKAKRLIERRLCWGKKMRQPQGSKTASRITSKSLMDAIQREAERQRFLVRESQRAKRQILLVETAVRKLRADVGFVNLLRALKLDDIPEMLEEKTR